MNERGLRGVLVAISVSALAGGCTLQVDSTDDSVDANPGDNRCRDSRGRCTLRAAVMEANATLVSERIEVPAGTYTLSLPTNAGGGPLVINSSVTIRGASATSTVIDAGAVSYNGQPGACPGSGITRPVFRIQGGTVGLAYLTLQGGYAQNGGGMFVDEGSVEITDAVIRRNAAFTGGGGILNAGGVVRIRRTTIQENCAVGAFGGGVWNHDGEVWIYESLIADNSSNRAGGVRNDGLLNLRSSTVSGNRAVSPDAGTGGISQGGFAVLNNVTMTNNVGHGRDTNSFLGGGLHTFSPGTTVMKNSIVAQNSGSGGPDDCVGPLTSDSRYNLIGSTAGCILPANTSTYVLNANPNLGALSSNGGPTRSHPLLAGSPARNAAYEYPLPASDGCESFDQRGVPHPQQGRCDMGAFESENASAAVSQFQLIDADTDEELFPLRNGELLNLTQLPPHLSIKASVSPSPGSVVFSWDGDAGFQVENNPPYALGGDNPAGDYLPVTLTNGQHVLRATPFAGGAGSGASGPSLEVRFGVIGAP